MAAFVKISPISLPSCPLFPNSPMSLVPNLGAHFSSYIVCNCWLQTIYSHELELYQRSTTRCPLCLPVVLAGRPHLCTSTSHELIVLSLTVPDFQPLLICVFSFAAQPGHTGYLPFNSSNFIFLFSKPTHFSMCQSPVTSGKEEEKHY